MPNNTLDRFQVLSHSELTYPHNCATCGSFSGDNGKQYIDFGLFVEYYGNVYICTECFYGAIKSIAQPTDEAKARIRELQAVVTTLITENRTLRDALDNLRSSVIDRPNTDTNHVNVVPATSVEAGSGRQPEQNTRVGTISKTDPVGEEREAGPAEQTNVIGSPQLRADDSGDSELIGLDIFKL